MMFESVAHPLLPVVVATVSLFFPTVSEAVHSNRGLHVHSYISHIPMPPIVFSSGWRQLQEQKRQDRVDANEAIYLVEDLWELQSDGESVG